MSYWNEDNTLVACGLAVDREIDISITYETIVDELNKFEKRCCAEINSLKEPQHFFTLEEVEIKIWELFQEGCRDVFPLGSEPRGDDLVYETRPDFYVVDFGLEKSENKRVVDGWSGGGGGDGGVEDTGDGDAVNFEEWEEQNDNSVNGSVEEVTELSGKDEFIDVSTMSFVWEGEEYDLIPEKNIAQTSAPNEIYPTYQEVQHRIPTQYSYPESLTDESDRGADAMSIDQYDDDFLMADKMEESNTRSDLQFHADFSGFSGNCSQFFYYDTSLGVRGDFHFQVSWGG